MSAFILFPLFNFEAISFEEYPDVFVKQAIRISYDVSPIIQRRHDLFIKSIYPVLQEGIVKLVWLVNWRECN